MKELKKKKKEKKGAMEERKDLALALKQLRSSLHTAIADLEQ